MLKRIAHLITTICLSEYHVIVQHTQETYLYRQYHSLRFFPSSRAQTDCHTSFARSTQQLRIKHLWQTFKDETVSDRFEDKFRSAQ